ncbi:OprO/OprP family phosphate-selective porin [Pseudomonas sp. LRF_L74]|uniref:OprO/OprP family phosphate-selective porin n=1 Tax=Pseudomonas sp. LRF_L74 TaxID=3369422 RepID=UPI003F604F96
MIRKHFAGFAASALALAVSAQAFAGTVTTDGADIVVKTKGGLEVATTDKAFAFKIGGRVQADYSTFDGLYTVNGDNADAAYFRRAFLEVGGTMFTDWKYQINYDLSHNSGGSDKASDGYFDEASLAYTGFGPLVIKVGRFDPDFGLEKATSSKWVTAPERNIGYDLMEWVNSHDGGLGVQLSGSVADSVYGSAGITAKDANDSDGDSTKQFNARVVFAPLHADGNVLHFGANFARRDADVASYESRFRTRMGMRGVSTDGGNSAGDNGNRVSVGSNFTAENAWDNDTAWGLEAAWAMGPFSLQGEYMTRKLKADTAIADREAKGGYLQAAYTITGEPRIYKLGKFDAIKPANKQIGAWEVFYRYDDFTVEDDNVTVATATRAVGDVDLKTHNLGVNWYANEAVRISATYVKAKADGVINSAAAGDDSGDGFVVRAQYAF